MMGYRIQTCLRNSFVDEKEPVPVGYPRGTGSESGSWVEVWSKDRSTWLGSQIKLEEGW